MPQVDLTDVFDENERYIETIAKMNSREAAIRSGQAGATTPVGAEAYELWSDTGDVLMRQRLGDDPDLFVALWKLNAAPWATIAHTMSATGTIPSATDAGTGAGATHVIIDELAADAGIGMPSAGAAGDQHRMILIERRDQSAYEVFLAFTTLQPMQAGSAYVRLMPGDVIALVSTASNEWTVVFENRGGVYTSTASGAPYSMQGWEKVLLINSSENHVLPDPATFRRHPYTAVNIRSSGAATLVPNDSETINGAGSLSLSSQYDRATVVSDGTNWFRID